MKKFIVILCFILGLSSLCFAASEDVAVLINKQVKVSYNEILQEFQNVNGDKVYPITYQGTTYLPIRSISSLFSTEIEWNGEENSIYLGEGELDETSAKELEEFVAEENEEVTALLNQDIKIFFEGEEQTFKDVNDNVVYPISYNGTTYLPVRAVSGLFDLSIQWDGENNAVLISDEPIDLDEEIFSGDEYFDDEEFDDEFSGDEYFDELLEDELAAEEEEAIEMDDSFIDEDGREVFYYFTDDDEVYYYYYDENDELVEYTYDDDGEIVYVNE